MLGPNQALPYATLALSSALAAFLYPHTLTGVLAARSADTIRRNAVMLPAYTLLLGLIALLGLMAHAAGIHTTHPNQVVPLLFLSIFPGWFAGFAFAAIAIGALVPASVMAIGAANLASRNIVRVSSDNPLRPEMVARIMALLVKLGALAFVLGLNPQFAIDLQLLGSVWILQTFPALVWCAWPGDADPSRHRHALLLGWLAGITLGTVLVALDGLKPVHVLTLAGASLPISTALIALSANLVAMLLVMSGRTLIVGRR